MPHGGRTPSRRHPSGATRPCNSVAYPYRSTPALSSGELTLQDWFEFAASLGLDGADISVVHLDSLDAAYLRDVQACARDCGLRIPMLVTYSDFTHPDADERARQAQDLVRHIAAAHELGASFIRVTAGQAHSGVSREEGVDWAVAGLTAALPYAHEAGVTLAYENHTRGYGWTRNDFSQPAAIFLDIARRSEGTGLSVLFDTANNLAHGDDPLPVLDAVKHRVAVVHLNDIRRAGHFEPVLLGTGVAPVVDLLAMLVDAGFDGWVSVEEASAQGPGVFADAMHTADRAWVQAGGSPRKPAVAHPTSQEE